MRTLTRWIRSKGPRLIAEDPFSVVSVDLKEPQIMLAQITRLGEGRDQHSVGLVLEQDGIRVKVAVTDPEEFLHDVTESVEWLRDPAAFDDAGHPDAPALSNDERDLTVPDGAQSAAPPTATRSAVALSARRSPCAKRRSAPASAPSGCAICDAAWASRCRHERLPAAS